MLARAVLAGLLLSCASLAAADSPGSNTTEGDAAPMGRAADLEEEAVGPSMPPSAPEGDDGGDGDGGDESAGEGGSSGGGDSEGEAPEATEDEDDGNDITGGGGGKGGKVRCLGLQCDSMRLPAGVRHAPACIEEGPLLVVYWGAVRFTRAM